MTRLCVLHVTPYFEHAWAYGGIPRVVTAQVHALAGRGVCPTVATTDARDSSSRLTGPQPGSRRRPFRLTTGDGVEVQVFPNLSNGLAYRKQFFTPRGLGDYLDREAARFDVAHLHGCHNLPGTIASRRLRRAEVPYVLQPNGTAPRIERRRLAKLVFDVVLGRHVMRDAATVIAVTDFERRQLEGLGVARDRLAVIPNPLDLAELDGSRTPGQLRARLGLGDGPVVLYLGQLSPRKRVDIAMRAIAKLERPDVRLVVAGSDMGTEQRLRHLAGRLGLEHRTVFAGVLEGDSRLHALADADVAVYPTQDEIFGLVPLEAILCGTPVVVSDDCGCGEVIRRTGGGVVAPFGDIGAFAAAIGGMLDDPQAWSGPVTEAAARAREHYGSGTVAAALEGLYRRLVGRRSP